MRIRSLIEFDKEDFEVLDSDSITEAERTACINLAWDKLTRLGYTIYRLTAEGKKLVVVASEDRDTKETLSNDNASQKPPETAQKASQKPVALENNEEAQYIKRQKERKAQAREKRISPRVPRSTRSPKQSIITSQLTEPLLAAYPTPYGQDCSTGAHWFLTNTQPASQHLHLFKKCFYCGRVIEVPCNWCSGIDRPAINNDIKYFKKKKRTATGSPSPISAPDNL